MNWWSMSKEETAKALETDLQTGVLTEEAKRIWGKCITTRTEKTKYCNAFFGTV